MPESTERPERVSEEAVASLVKRLLGVPVTACWEEESGEGSDYQWRTVPVGVYCHQAAREIEALEEETRILHAQAVEGDMTLARLSEEIADLRAQVAKQEAVIEAAREYRKTTEAIRYDHDLKAALFPELAALESKLDAALGALHPAPPATEKG